MIFASGGSRFLNAYGVDPCLLRDNILNTIRTKLLDIVSLGSLEAAQTCVLLGTYYLYHGNPGLAWPVCGCGLRIAQALNLHRKLPLHPSAKRHASGVGGQFTKSKPFAPCRMAIPVASRTRIAMLSFQIPCRKQVLATHLLLWMRLNNAVFSLINTSCHSCRF